MPGVGDLGSGSSSEINGAQPQGILGLYFLQEDPLVAAGEIPTIHKK